jgi:hypothetical protein
MQHIAREEALISALVVPGDLAWQGRPSRSLKLSLSQARVPGARMRALLFRRIATMRAIRSRQSNPIYRSTRRGRIRPGDVATPKVRTRECLLRGFGTSVREREKTVDVLFSPERPFNSSRCLVSLDSVPALYIYLLLDRCGHATRSAIVSIGYAKISRES